MISMDEWMLNDVLECSVCLEQLDSTSKVLPCQHTFCKRCLEEIVSSRKELRCPECRVLVDIKVDELPCNILLIRILEGMKNAPRNKSIQTSSADLLDLHRGRPQPPIPHHSISKPGSTDNYIPSPPKQPSSQVQPCARALYPYEAKEPGDLSFQKGDVIILRKKIDQNWFHGELAGKFGFFPASYIQVITPLPTHLCKALYDFIINGNDEKDCLTFSKGDVITVIRRVDENWAEGRLGERIGIFPISFVEMNSAAKSLMKLSTNVQSGPSRVAPPTPSSDSDTTPLITSSNAGGRLVNHPCVSSSSSSSTSSTSTSSSSSSSSSTSSPTSPPASVTQLTHPLPPPPTHYHHHNNSQQQHHHHHSPLYQANLQQQREKRHSFVGMHHSRPAPPLPSSNRHSLELVSSSQVPNLGLTSAHAIPPAMSSVPLIPVPVVHPRHKHSSQEMPPAPSSIPLIPVPIVQPRHKHGSQVSSDVAHLSLGKSSQDTSGCSSTPNLSLATDSGGPPTHVSVPIFYLALYPYKPQKEDELELRKGELYTVSEKCQDGWFKGTSLRTGSSGVFPGNYVQAAKSSLLQAHFRQTSSSLASVRPTSSRTGTLPLSSPTRSSGRSHSSMGSNGRSGDNLSRARAAAAVVSERTQGFLDWARSVTALAVPPKPPHPHSPRFQSHTSPRQSGHRSAAPELPPRVVTQVLEPATASPTVGLAVPQPAISQSWHGTPSTPPQPGPPQAAQMSRSVLSTATAITPPNISMSSSVVSSTASPASSSGQTHRYDKVQKMGKRHRKGSDKVSFVKMLTIKKKGKMPVQCAYSMDNPVFVDCTPTSSAPSVSAATPPANHVRSESCPSDVVFTSNTPQCGHRKSNSIDGSTDGTITSANNGKVRPKQPAPLVRERFRCIVPYPPNSEYELELKVGDVIYVHKKRDDGWYKGTLNRTGKTGLFPGSFVEGF